MKLKRYNNFNSTENVSENVAQAKKYLLDKYLADNEVKKEDLKPEQIKELERLPDYVTIRDMVSRNPGWTYVFTRFFFEDGIGHTELKSLYDTLVELKSLLNRLPKTVDKYTTTFKREDGSEVSAYENLSDDLENIKRYRNYKHFIDELPAQMKHEVESSGVLMKEKIENLAVEFYKLAEELQKNFIKKLSRYRYLNDLIRVWENYLKASSGQGFNQFIEKIEELNDRMTEKHGAVIVYSNEEEERIIIELRSFEACKTLCANTAWCIAQWHSHWDSYVGGDEVYSKQYALFDFSLSPADNMSIVGCTINQGDKWRTGHVKNDAGISEREFRKTLNNEENAVLIGPSREEVEQKKRYVKASKILRKEGITIKEAMNAIKDGADVNSGNGLPLLNAVKSNNLELIEYYLSIGAVPNLSPSDNDAPINHTKSLEIIKLLVSKGANFTSKSFKNFCDSRTGDFNIEAIEYFLKNGMNINFEGGYALRNAVRNGNLAMTKFLIERGADPNQKNGMAISWCIEWLTGDRIEEKKNLAMYLLTCNKTSADNIMKAYQRAYDRSKKSDNKNVYVDVCEKIEQFAKEKQTQLVGLIEKIKKA